MRLSKNKREGDHSLNGLGLRYGYLVNKKECFNFLTGKDFDNVFLSENTVPVISDIEHVKESCSAVVMILYQHNFDEYLKALKFRSRDVIVFSNQSIACESFEMYKDFSYYQEDDRIVVRDIKVYLDYIPQIIRRADDVMYDRMYFYSKEYRRSHCGNCGARMREIDKYCRICGTLWGEGRFEARYNTGYGDILYGPIYIVQWECPRCGETWKERGMKKYKYCNQCGAEGHIKKCAEKWPWEDIVDDEI